MDNKYLPIGTVCTIKGNTNKIMIVGFLSLDYNGNLNVYDYKGCIYPKGLFSSGGTISFNHNDIEKVEFMGYKTDLHTNLSSNLTNASVIDTVKNQTKSNIKSQYVFDKNGVIIMDNTHQQHQTEKEEIQKEFHNPFALKYEEIKQNNNIERRFEFDENGVIIADNTVSNENKVVENNTPKQNNINNKFEFDENGVIIADNTVSNESKEVENNTPKQNNINSRFEFDENGVIIADNTVSNENKEVENNKPKQNNINDKFVFDENGVIIAEN